ncbi:MAG: hypothetical protein JWQ97_616 [Phenylobacterium sp.]|nr:hypothetical protein [Phenylobacterium sp.]
MKRPTVASQKKVTVENLARLGAERLAEILAMAADTKPELKRRLRMELAAEQGAEHLAVEIDRRLASLQTSGSKVHWRQRVTFVRDLDGLRTLIAERLASLDRPAALNRLWRFMDVARRVGLRVRDRDGELAGVFQRAARDIGGLIAEVDAAGHADVLAEAAVRNPVAWADWLPNVLDQAPPGLAAAALRRLSEKPDPTPGRMTIIRQLADAAGDVEAFRATFTEAALRTPAVAANIAQRLLAAGRVEEAGHLLEAAGPTQRTTRSLLAGNHKVAEPDFEWETVWIDYLEHSGESDAAQAARWSSFERTLSAERAKAFTVRLTGFDDVEAEGRAFDHAARDPDFQRGLQFLMEWPALPEAARMIQARPEDVDVSAEKAELWAAKLRGRQPAAAHQLLRKAAAAAFRRRDLATCDRLTQEADAFDV